MKCFGSALAFSKVLIKKVLKSKRDSLTSWAFGASESESSSIIKSYSNYREVSVFKMGGPQE